ncbi:putative carbonic anhydrase 1 isoform X2 [Littorina saxatilis]|uniref:putative carbonic anhydrase 1 isoform X2 n=1 Tax=Littorina saxatilis TaxID=31220 RepID=UPI0038B67F9C
MTHGEGEAKLGHILFTLACVLWVVLAVLIPSASVKNPLGSVGKAPRCGKGYTYFRDFMKCDSSLGYCFHYGYSSCLGPTNWACVDPLNRIFDSVDGESQGGFLKRAGLGNSRCCGGSFQSPVDIPIIKAVCPPKQFTPEYLNKDMEVEGTLKNSLYPEFKVNARDYNIPLVLKDVPFSCAVPGSSLYVFKSVQFHAGKAGSESSEHLLQGKRYDGEIHLVHVRRDFWKPADGPDQPSRLDSQCASQTPLGMTIIAVFLSLTEGEKNQELRKLLSRKSFSVIQESEKACNIDRMCDRQGRIFGDEEPCGPPVNEDDQADSSNRRRRRRGRRKRTDRRKRGLGPLCFCRRLRYKEIFLYPAKRGEELQCRLLHHSQLPAVNPDGTIRKPIIKAPCTPDENGLCPNDNKLRTVKPGLLLPTDTGYYQYFGSLTTPPCSEVVNWIVMKTPLKVTLQQLKAIQNLDSVSAGENIGTYGNTRPPLPLSGRLVTTNIC